MTCSRLNVDGVETLLNSRGNLSAAELAWVSDVVRAVIDKYRGLTPVDEWTDLGGEA